MPAADDSPTINGFSYQELEFAKDGSQVDPNQVTAVGDLAGRVTDLMVICHGWNNNIDEARALYRDLSASMRSVLQLGNFELGDRVLGIVGVLWPSKRFTDAELIPGGAAGAAADPTLPDDLRAMAGAFVAADADGVLNRAAQLVEQLDYSVDARNRYVELLCSLIQPSCAEAADAVDELFSLSGDELLNRIDKAVLAVLAGALQAGPSPGLGTTSDGAGTGGISPVAVGSDVRADGGAAGLFDGLNRIWSQGRALLNYLTYYTMKARAGDIGAKSLGPALAASVVGRIRLHLVGHSFGARLVTAAANSLRADAVSSLSLLQAAFSHNSFAVQWQPGHSGGFRHLIEGGGVNGPIIITHTRNDQAVGIAYAIASSIAGQNAEAIGDANSPFGGLGSNGAQHTPEARNDVPLQDVTAIYQFDNHVIYNLLADTYISSHGDVTNVQTANAVLQAVCSPAH